MTYDVAALRRHFPALAEGAAHFDGPGGSQVPEQVAGAVARALTSAISNRGRSTRSERRADDTVAQARQAMADLVGGEASGVVFGRSMTQLTYDMARTLAKGWSSGDEVVVSRLDHDANIRPWVQAAQVAGARSGAPTSIGRAASFTPADVEKVMTRRTRVVAITAASNLLGTRPDVAAIAKVVHAAGALLYVDGVQPDAPTRQSTCGLWARTSSCARPTSSWARTAAP